MRPRVVAATFVALVLLAGCTPRSTEVKTERVDVPIPAERSADVTLAMRSGHLRLAGGAAGLLEGTLSYQDDTRPRVTTGSREAKAGKVVTVAVEQPVSTNTTPPLWDLLVNGGLPTNVTVSNASGEIDLDLKLADPKLLTVDSSSGNVKVGLAGPHPSLSQLNVHASSGNVEVAATGEYPALEGLDVQCSSGEVEADFAGTWRKDFTANVGVSSGNVTIVLPRDVNVVVSGGTDSGTVSAEGFSVRRRHGGPAGSPPPRVSGWSRQADKPSSSTLTVLVRISSGNLTLRVADKK